MSSPKLIVAIALALVTFVGNFLLCCAALQHTFIDVASFTIIRLISGALTPWRLVQLTRREASGRGSWPSAVLRW